ncbi:MAG: methyltransferase domain-containing protein [Gemmatimonadota bacterium]
MNVPGRLAVNTSGSFGLPTDAELIRLLDAHAPFGPTSLVPEVSVFYARSLVETWEAAELLAGRILPAPFWAYPWAAGVGLARVILDYPDWVAGKRVLDFGCGGGVAALAAARAGAHEVIANDVDPWALAVARLAADRQGLALTPFATDLTMTGAVRPAFDVLICSDLSYEKQQAPGQRSVLEAARRSGARVLVADAGRAYFRDDRMKLLAKYEIAVPRDLEGVEQRTALVFELLG